MFWWQGKRTAVIRDHNGLLLEQLQPSSCLPWCAGQASATVKYGESACLIVGGRSAITGVQHCRHSQTSPARARN